MHILISPCDMQITLSCVKSINNIGDTIFLFGIIFLFFSSTSRSVSPTSADSADKKRGPCVARAIPTRAAALENRHFRRTARRIADALRRRDDRPTIVTGTFSIWKRLETLTRCIWKSLLSSCPVWLRDYERSK